MIRAGTGHIAIAARSTECTHSLFGSSSFAPSLKCVSGTYVYDHILTLARFLYIQPVVTTSGYGTRPTGSNIIGTCLFYSRARRPPSVVQLSAPPPAPSNPGLARAEETPHCFGTPALPDTNTRSKRGGLRLTTL